MKRWLLPFVVGFFCMPVFSMQSDVKRRRVHDESPEMQEEFLWSQKQLREGEYALAENEFRELAKQNRNAEIKVRACLALARLYFFGCDGVKKKMRSMKAYLSKAVQAVEEHELPDGEVSLIEKLYKNYRNENQLLLELGLRRFEEPALSLLSFAMEKNYVDMVDLLLAMHVNDVMLNGPKEPSLLREAVRLKRDEIVELFLSHGADHRLDMDGESNTLLHIARTPTIMKALIRHGARVLVRNRQGKTPLHIVAQGWDAYDVRGVLGALLEGEDPKLLLDARDHEGRTALHYAAEEGHLEVVIFLIAYGADLSIVDNDGNRAEDLVDEWAPSHFKLKRVLRGARYDQEVNSGFMGKLIAITDIYHPLFPEVFFAVVSTGWLGTHLGLIAPEGFYQLVGLLMPSAASLNNSMLWKAFVYGGSGMSVLSSLLRMYGGPTWAELLCQPQNSTDVTWCTGLIRGFTHDFK